MSKLVRVDDELYSRLHKLAGKLQSQKGRPVSISDAIRSLTERSKRKSPLGRILPPARFTTAEGRKEAMLKRQEKRELRLASKKKETGTSHSLKEFSFKHGSFE